MLTKCYPFNKPNTYSIFRTFFVFYNKYIQLQSSHSSNDKCSNLTQHIRNADTQFNNSQNYVAKDFFPFKNSL